MLRTPGRPTRLIQSPGRSRSGSRPRPRRFSMPMDAKNGRPGRTLPSVVRQDRPDLWLLLNPRHLLRPLLLLHGSNCPRVSTNQADCPIAWVNPCRMRRATLLRTDQVHRPITCPNGLLRSLSNAISSRPVWIRGVVPFHLARLSDPAPSSCHHRIRKYLRSTPMLLLRRRQQTPSRGSCPGCSAICRMALGIRMLLPVPSNPTRPARRRTIQPPVRALDARSWTWKSAIHLFSPLTAHWSEKCGSKMGNCDASVV